MFSIHLAADNFEDINFKSAVSLRL